MKKSIQSRLILMRFIQPTFYLVGLFSIFLANFTQAAAAARLDLTFGNSGKATAYFESYSAITDLAVQPDGKVVASKLIIVNGENDFGVSRFNADGSLDQTFGNGGTVALDVSGEQDYAYLVAIQTDGKIVASGSVDSPQAGGFRTAIVRFNSNGTLDTAFGNFGRTIVETPSNQPNAIVIQPDGKIVVAGHTTDFTGGTRANFFLVRCNADGFLDNSFGVGGKVVTDFQNSNEVIYGLALQADGKIVAAGTTGLDTPEGDIAVARYNANGAPDTSFGTNGKLTTDFFTNLDEAKAVAVQPNGKIIVGGSAGFSGGKLAAVLRYNSNGSLDETFGKGGKSTNNFPQRGVHDLLVQANNKIIVGGIAKLQPTDEFNFALTRLNADGTTDLTFDDDGQLVTKFALTGNLNAILLQPDGKLIAAGSTYDSDTNTTGDALARYILTNAAADFDGDNRTDVTVFRPSDGTWYLNQSRLGFSATAFGIASDKITPADFDGDGRADIAVFRSGIWYILRTSDNKFRTVQFGQNGDVPVAADYNADGIADVAVFRAGIWYVLNSGSNQVSAIQFGIATDKLVPADYDRDGKTDVAIYREGIWYIMQSNSQTISAVPFGNATDTPITGDFDGDGKADQTVFRNGTWYQNLSQSISMTVAVQFGEASDIPLAGDFDGDDKDDIAVFRNGVWYFQNSTNGFSSVAFGNPTDRPIPNFYQP